MKTTHDGKSPLVSNGGCVQTQVNAASRGVRGGSKKPPPLFVQRMDAIRKCSGTFGAERAVLLASIRWAGPDGRVCPSRDKWADMAGVKVRTLQRVLKKLVDRGIVKSLGPTDGGAYRTREYLIVPFVVASEADSGLVAVTASETPTPRRGSDDHEPRRQYTETPTPATANPDNGDREPRRHVTQSSSNHPGESSKTTNSGVVARLSSDLQRHQNATPERLAWIEREAPTKRNPEAWAASCIRAGWEVPVPSSAELARSKLAGDRIRREANLTRFNAMKQMEREPILKKAMVAYPAVFGSGSDENAKAAQRSAISMAMDALAAESGGGGS